MLQSCIIGILAAALVILLIGDLIKSRSPEGYEDKDGWHRGANEILYPQSLYSNRSGVLSDHLRVNRGRRRSKRLPAARTLAMPARMTASHPDYPRFLALQEMLCFLANPGYTSAMSAIPMDMPDAERSACTVEIKNALRAEIECFLPAQFAAIVNDLEANPE